MIIKCNKDTRDIGDLTIHHLPGKKCWRYNGRRVIVVEFKYDSKKVKQAFYQTSGFNAGGDFFGCEGMWFPFDGIISDPKYDHDVWSYHIDKLAFSWDKPVEIDGEKIYPRLGDSQLLRVSYLLGGGLWSSKESMAQVDCSFSPRKQKINLETQEASPEDINAFIGSALTYNYYRNGYNHKLNVDSPINGYIRDGLFDGGEYTVLGYKIKGKMIYPGFIPNVRDPKSHRLVATEIAKLKYQPV